MWGPDMQEYAEPAVAAKSSSSVLRNDVAYQNIQVQNLKQVCALRHAATAAVSCALLIVVPSRLQAISSSPINLRTSASDRRCAVAAAHIFLVNIAMPHVGKGSCAANPLTQILERT